MSLKEQQREAQEEQEQAQAQGAEEEAQQGADPAAEAGEGDGDVSLAFLQEELAQARKEAQEHYDKLLRLAAEFENYKKRMEREQQTARKYAEESLLKELLPSLDNLERAAEEARKAGESSALLEGVEMTRKGLLATLEKFGLVPIESVGQPFDPSFHEALTMEPSDEVPANHVLREFQKGYQYKERLLRAAKVVVSSGPAGS